MTGSVFSGGASVAANPPGRRRSAADQLWPMVALSAGLVVMAWAGSAFDSRLFGGVGVWEKPLKFALSFVVYYATLAAITDRMSPTHRNGWLIVIAVPMACINGILEFGYIAVMAGRGQASHFNESAPIYEVLYGLMGLGALLLMVAVALVAIAVWRDPAARMGAGLRFGVVTGLLASAAMTLVIGFTLGGNGGHFIGVPPPDAKVLPLFGWSAAVGDLRVSHFLSLHAMQAGPLLGWLADRAQARNRAVWVAAGLAIYAALSFAVYFQALAGMPLIRL